MVRIIEGQGLRITKKPPSPSGRLLPSMSTTSAMMPGSGSVAVPGTSGVAPGSGLIMMEPVSVCHQVSTMGQRPPPMTRWYQVQASGLIGSPTLPSSRRLERSCRAGCSSPQRMKARMAVGAV